MIESLDLSRALPQNYKGEEATPTPLFDALNEALFAGDEGLSNFREVAPGGPHDFFLTLIKIYNLHLGDLSPLDGETRYANHPKVASLKWNLENRWLLELGAIPAPALSDDETPCGVIKEKCSHIAHAAHAGSTEAVCGAHISAVNRAFLELSYLTPFRNLTIFAADSRSNADPSEFAHQAHPWELLALEAFAGLLATNHWLLPEALGALSAHSLKADVEFTPDSNLPANPDTVSEDIHSSDALEELDKILLNRPEWSERVIVGASWYAHLDAALAEALTKE